MKRALLTCLVLLAATTQVVRPDVALVLRDGRLIEGVDARRDGDVYVLELQSGERITFPVELVEEVRLIGVEKTPPVQHDFRNPDPQTIGGGDPDPDGPSGFTEAGPQVLAGQNVRPPTPTEQTRALGPAAQFQKGVVTPDWHPETDWNMNAEEQNNFAPSTWAKDVVDNDWQPKSAFDDKDVLESGNSEFQSGVVSNDWQPTDAFKKNDDFWGGS